MTSSHLVALVSLGAALVLGCESGTPASAEPPAPLAAPVKAEPAPTPRVFGAAIGEGTITSLTTLAAEPAKFAGQTVKTEGTVKAVCKSMGCWMEIADPSGQAHVKMAGHAFFVPKDCQGKRAVVQGTVVAKDPEACADGCREKAEKEMGTVAQVEIEATGVALLE